MKPLIAIILIVAVVALGRTAHADDREDARREFAAGQDADKAGDFDAAIEHYLRANDLLSHPFTIYNIAADYERLGKLREAAGWYERYLDAAPASPDRDKVARKLADLRARKSPLSVRSFPEGARVTIDDQPAGTTPVSTRLGMGTHHVAVDLAGQHAEKDVDVGFGEPADLAFTLGGVVGTLSVGGNPVGAYVAVDNITIGAVPATTQISPGEHTVRVTAAGFSPYEGTANVAPNAETHVDAELIRMLGAPITTPPTGQQSNVALLVGLVGGAEVQSGSPDGLAMIGTRILRYDVVFRAGRAHDGLSLDFVVRWSLLDARITPILSGGYAYTNGGYGYLFNAGIRWDVAKGDHTTLSLVVDGGVRVIAVTDAASSTGSSSTVVYPIELGAEVIFK